MWQAVFEAALNEIDDVEHRRSSVLHIMELRWEGENNKTITTVWCSCVCSSSSTQHHQGRVKIKLTGVVGCPRIEHGEKMHNMTTVTNVCLKLTRRCSSSSSSPWWSSSSKCYCHLRIRRERQHLQLGQVLCSTIFIRRRAIFSFLLWFVTPSFILWYPSSTSSSKTKTTWPEHEMATGRATVIIFVESVHHAAAADKC